jgi:hypothetical protein
LLNLEQLDIKIQESNIANTMDTLLPPEKPNSENAVFLFFLMPIFGKQIAPCKFVELVCAVIDG